MNDISEAVNTAMSNMISGGKIEEIIAEKIEKTVESALDDVLRSYSDFGKELKDHISEKLCFDLSNLNIDEYNKSIIGMVEGAMGKVVTESANEKLLSEINDILKKPPESITLQTLIDDYIKDNNDEAARDQIESCGLFIEKSDYGYIYVGLHESTESGSGYSSKSIDSVQSCDLQLHFRQDKESGELEFAWISFGGYKETTTKDLFPSGLYGFSKRLFQMYCAGTKVTLDHGLYADDYSTQYSWYDY